MCQDIESFVIGMSIGTVIIACVCQFLAHVRQDTIGIDMLFDVKETVVCVELVSTGILVEVDAYREELLVRLDMIGMALIV